MRIRQERLDSNIRVSNLAASIHQAIEDSDDETTLLEALDAIASVQVGLVTALRREETPVVDDDEGRHNFGPELD